MFLCLFNLRLLTCGEIYFVHRCLGQVHDWSFSGVVMFIVDLKRIWRADLPFI